MATSGDAHEVYEQARAKARRTPTFLLRRRQRRVMARVRQRWPDAADLAELAAARVELDVRSVGAGSRDPAWREGRWWQSSGR
jgi:hypothetical protein